MFKVCDHIDFKIYIQLYKYTITYNHDNHHCVFFEKVKLTSMAHDHIDFRYIYIALIILIIILNSIM